jgi:hypothetical protein
MNEVEKAFHERAVKIYKDAKAQIRYPANRFLQMIRRDGGLAAAKHWLRVHYAPL